MHAELMKMAYCNSRTKFNLSTPTYLQNSSNECKIMMASFTKFQFSHQVKCAGCSSDSNIQLSAPDSVQFAIIRAVKPTGFNLAQYNHKKSTSSYLTDGHVKICTPQRQVQRHVSGKIRTIFMPICSVRTWLLQRNHCSRQNCFTTQN